MAPISSLLSLWGSTLWQVSMEAVVLTLFISVIALVCRRASPAFHYWLWSIVLLRLCIPVTVSVPLFDRATLPVADVIPAAVLNEVVIGATSATAALLPWNPILLWFFTVLLLLLLILRRVRVVMRLLQHAESANRPELLNAVRQWRQDMHLQRPVAIYATDAALKIGPAVIGLRRPAILLPRIMAEEWPVADLEPMLIHELTHIKRRDLLVNAVQVLVQIVYWFHPIVWFVNGRIRRLREDICDDMAIHRSNGGREAYPASMLRVLQTTGGVTMSTPLIAGFTEAGRSLARRIARTLGAGYRGYRPLSAGSAVALAVIAVTGFVIAQCSSTDHLIDPTAVHNAEVAALNEEVPANLPPENQPQLMGGNLAGQLAKLIKYPESARSAGIQGQVIVRALIGKDGNVEQTQIAKGIPNSGCDEAAENAVRQLKFKPATQDGNPVKFWFAVPITFSLR